MEVKVEKLEKSEVKVSIKLSADEMKKYEDKAAERLSQEVKIDGFRAGKANAESVKARVGETTFEAQMVEMALSESYAKAVIENKIDVVSQPKVSIKSHNPLEFEATAAVLPEVKIKDYTKINVKKKEVKINDKDVKEIMESLCRRESTFKEVDREVKKGDKVEVDFTGYDKDGAELPGTKSKSHPVIIGDEMLIPGFEDGLIGMKKDEEKRLKLKFPKKYHAEKFQGKDVEFQVKLNKVEKVLVPELNDEFAKKTSQGNAKTVADLEKDIKTHLTEVREEDEKQRQEGEFLEEIVKLTEVEIPQAMVDREIDFMLERSKSNMEAKGMDFDKYMAEQAENGKDPRKDLAEPAKKQVTLRLALQEIYNKENLEVTDKDIEAEIAEISKSYPPQYVDTVRQMYEKGSDNYKVLQNKIKLDKVIKKYLKKKNMKTFYLVGSILMTTVILVLAFENIQASCNYITFFFYEVPSGTPPTMTIFFEAVLGVIAGVFYTKLVSSWAGTDEDEEDEDY